MCLLVTNGLRYRYRKMLALVLPKILPVSMALKMSERKRVAKNSLDQIFPFSAFSSRAVLGIPCNIARTKI